MSFNKGDTVARRSVVRLTFELSSGDQPSGAMNSWARFHLATFPQAHLVNEQGAGRVPIQPASDFGCNELRAVLATAR